MRFARPLFICTTVFVAAIACQHSSSSLAASSHPSAVTQTRPAPSQPDIEFMQGMIGHHTQAIEMTELLKTRTARDDMKLLGQRIGVAQADEIKMMGNWLRDRKQRVPTADDYKMMMAMPAMAMPGMLTQEEMDKLAAAKGADFDRLFLEGMIKHHQGALTMVEKLMASKGGGQDSAVFAFASEVQADQSAEIIRMRALRATMGK